MPDLDGLSAIRQIQTDPEVGATPMIALTALAMPGDRERCLAVGRMPTSPSQSACARS